MVHACIKMRIPPDKLEEVVGILISFARQTRYEPGCLRCNVYLDGEMTEEILLDEFWSDQTSLDAHLLSIQARVVFEIAELSTVPPEFRFETINHLSGLESVEMTRVHASDSTIW
jgi:quinol monooxygenase YgiN